MGSVKTVSPLTKAKALSIVAQHMADVRADEVEGLTQKQKDKIALWSEDPWKFLTGTDVDDKTPVYFTKDEIDEKRPIKPFPHHAYLKDYIYRLHTERIVFAEKARQLMFSTTTLAYASWQCLFIQGRRWLLAKNTEGEAEEMLRDKVRLPISHMPKWFQKWADVAKTPAIRCDYRRMGSYILAATANVAERAARGGTASGTIADEAAFTDEFGAIIQASMPMQGKIFAITTPNIGPGGTVFQNYITDEDRV